MGDGDSIGDGPGESVLDPAAVEPEPEPFDVADGPGELPPDEFGVGSEGTAEEVACSCEFFFRTSQ